jgi:hypothetical protein
MKNGSHGKTPLVLGGFVADAENWKVFSAECNEITDFFDVPYFHMTTFCSAHAKIYRHLSDTRKVEFLGTILHAIREHAIAGIFSVVLPAEYESLTTPEYRSRNGSAYALCVNGCMVGLWEFLTNQSKRSETVSIFLEDGHRNSLEAIEQIRGYKDSTDPVDLSGYEIIEGEIDPLRGPGLKVGSYGLGRKSAMRPLWAADLLAYCIHGSIMNRNDEFLPGVMDKIEERVPCYGSQWDAAAIGRLIEATIEGDAKRAQQRYRTHVMRRYLGAFGIKSETLPYGIIFDASGMTDEQKLRFLADDEEQPQ